MPDSDAQPFDHSYRGKDHWRRSTHCSQGVPYGPGDYGGSPYYHNRGCGQPDHIFPAGMQASGIIIALENYVKSLFFL